MGGMMNAEQLRRLSEIFKDEIEGAEEGVSTAETLRRISDRIMELATDGEETETDVARTFRVGDVVRAEDDILAHSPIRTAVPRGTKGKIVATGGTEWVTVRFEGHDRDLHLHVTEVDK